MSTTQEQGGRSADDQGAYWLRDPFWSRLSQVEGLHLRLQSQHEAVRRELTAIPSARNTGFRDVWLRYCEVIRELDMTTAELEALRTRPE
ncbi:MAG TPA: hypothetical protein VK727_12965 [Steroidobacteraceae bacterium]|jgi:hypothetical protein|nr:hypothetical protein [Steroidobacteraceae bacterium]